LEAMIGLYLEGALEKCATFPHAFSVKALLEMNLSGFYEIRRVDELITALGPGEAHAPMTSALTASVNRAKQYFDLVHKAALHVTRYIPPDEPCLLLDEEWIRRYMGFGRRVLPFTERNGQYDGPPKDDDAAIAEFHRLVSKGGKYFVYWPQCRWWAECYGNFFAYLRRNFRCLIEDESILILDLSRAPAV